MIGDWRLGRRGIIGTIEGESNYYVPDLKLKGKDGSLKVAVIDAGRKERRKYLFILLLYLLILNCGIDYWTGLDWAGFIQ